MNRVALFLFALVHVLFEEGHVELERLGEQTTGLDELRALSDITATENLGAAAIFAIADAAKDWLTANNK